MERVELDRNGIDEASLEEIKKLLEASGKESIIFVRVFVWSTSFWRDIRFFSFLHSFAPLAVEHVPFEAETMPAPSSLGCGVIVEKRVCCTETEWRCCEEAK